MQFKFSLTIFPERLQGNNKTTHFISKIRYQLAFYNLNAIRGIHPVSGGVLFEAPLSKADSCAIVL